MDELMTAISFYVLNLMIIYFVVKYAVKNALRESEGYMRSVATKASLLALKEHDFIIEKGQKK